MDLEGEAYYISFKDTRSVKWKAGTHGRSVGLAKKSYSYMAQKKMYYAKEKRALQRESCQNGVAMEESVNFESDCPKKTRASKKQKAVERQRVVIAEPAKCRMNKHDKERLFHSQKKNGFYKLKGASHTKSLQQALLLILLIFSCHCALPQLYSKRLITDFSPQYNKLSYFLLTSYSLKHIVQMNNLQNSYSWD
eukprot:TRINITY_DN5471_c3_g1_i1.p3 TRINITY_DN5471_c3_g1~~TRINITY_DN5471_c3_g1_i1.p3  ORF type:complete len:194 (-),score=9.89 TRINITY_DN5471_c3_g1_i1:2295-2876(-)